MSYVLVRVVSQHCSFLSSLQLQHSHLLAISRHRPHLYLNVLQVADMLVVMGGYRDNHHYDDFWQYNMTTRKWRQRTDFVFPVYPRSCTDDIDYIEVRLRSTFDWQFGGGRAVVADCVAAVDTRRCARRWCWWHLSSAACGVSACERAPALSCL
jgi:Kelch motif